MIVVIKNARAGSKRTSTQELTKMLGPRGHLIEPRSLEALEQEATYIAKTNPELIVIWGGDGTVTATLSALVAAYGEQTLPPFCLIPGGTMNVVARSLGVRGRPEAAFARLLAAPDKLPIMRRPVIRLGRQTGFLFGVGLQANFLDLIYKGARAGMVRTVSVLARSSLSAFSGTRFVTSLFDPFRARLIVDGKDWSDGPWVNVSAGGVEGVGLGFKPYTRAGEREGSFHVIAHNLSAPDMVKELPGTWLGRGMKKVTQDVAREVTLELERPLRYSIDGEIYDPCDRFELRGGLVLNLVVP